MNINIMPDFSVAVSREKVASVLMGCGAFDSRRADDTVRAAGSRVTHYVFLEVFLNLTCHWRRKK